MTSSDMFVAVASVGEEEMERLYYILILISSIRFDIIVSVTKLRVIGHLVSVTKLHVFNHLESVTKPQVFHYL